jgi:hypothetical protein
MNLCAAITAWTAAGLLVVAGCGTAPKRPSAVIMARWLPGCSGSNSYNSPAPDLYAVTTAQCGGNAFPSGLYVDTFTSASNLTRWMAGSQNDLKTMYHGKASPGHFWAVEPVADGNDPRITRALGRHGLHGTWTSSNNCCG